MNIALIGTGNMGSAFAKQLDLAGHSVRIAGRNIEKAQAVATQFGNVEATVIEQVAMDRDVIILATGYGDAVQALQHVGDIDGKVIIDITNPLTPDYMGLTVGHDSSAAEEIAKSFPNAQVVKAFNTLFAQVLSDGPNFANGQRGTVFVASDSARAKSTAIALAESIGFETVDAGGLVNARYLEPLAGLNIYLGYGAGLGTSIAPTWIRK